MKRTLAIAAICAAIWFCLAWAIHADRPYKETPK